MKLLIIEDNEDLLQNIHTYLKREGYICESARNYEQAFDKVMSYTYDVVLIDIMLPGGTGLQVLRELKSVNPQTGTIIISAKNALDDKVKGLTVGGDDYVTKPFSLEEVVARIRAVLRRTQTVEPEDEDTVLRVADLELDEDRHEVSRGGRIIDVSPTEFKLLRYLMLNAGRVLSKAQILDHVWDYDFRGEMGIVESYISYLRRKIDTEGEPMIHTKRGVGYVLREPRHSESA